MSGPCAGGRITAGSGRANQFGALPPPVVETVSCCADSPPPPPAQLPHAHSDALPPPAAADAFKIYLTAVNAPGALQSKQKKLIALALSVISKCGPCVKINAKAAREAGASEEEIGEAVALGIAFGGAPVAMFYNTVRNE